MALVARLDLSFPDGRSFQADLSPLGHRRLMVAFATAITDHADSGGGVASPATASGYVAALRRFAAHLDNRRPGADLGPGEPGPDDLDTFEEALRPRYPTGSTTPSMLVNI